MRMAKAVTMIAHRSSIFSLKLRLIARTSTAGVVRRDRYSQIMDQIPDEWTDPSAEERVLYEMASSDGEPNVSPSMLAKIEEVIHGCESFLATPPGL